MRIGIVAPSTPFWREDAERVSALAAAITPELELIYHPQSFLVEGHFAGPDQAREDALVEMANRPDIDAIWFARGGYGACRIAERAIARMADCARDKIYMGYSDQGFLLGGLYAQGFKHLFHGPMPVDIKKVGGEAAVERALRWLATRDPASLEPSVKPSEKVAAFNLVILSQMIGTPLMPDLAGHVLMLEEVCEYHYAIDRAMFHVTTNLAPAGLAGIRLGRTTLIPENDRPFGQDEVEIVQYWCERHGIPYLGRADIAHDVANKIVPYGVI
jgi:muramoyltetrapeptide carboxypeptidase